MIILRKYIRDVLHETYQSHTDEPLVGAVVINANENCKHKGSEGVVLSIEELSDDQGKVIEYKCTNSGPTWEVGDVLSKTMDQLSPHPGPALRGYSVRMREADLRQSIREVLLEKRWADLNAPKGQTIPLKPEDFEYSFDYAQDSDSGVVVGVRNLNDEIFDLIQTAYKDVELTPADGETSATYGNIKVPDPSALPGKYTIMKAADIDEDPEPDYFRGGKMRNGRFKLGIVGHDGSEAAISRYLEETAEDLNAGGIGEMSGKIAHIMITRHGIPAVPTKEAVEAALGKQVDWVGRHPDPKYADRYGPDYEAWYCRGISGTCGGDHMKILLGGG